MNDAFYAETTSPPQNLRAASASLGERPQNLPVILHDFFSELYLAFKIRIVGRQQKTVRRFDRIQ